VKKKISDSESPTLVYYDGWCSVCCRSADYFTNLDRDRHVLICVDLRSDDERISLAGVSAEELVSSLHTLTPDGILYRGPEAIRVAMKTLGRNRTTAWTRWPIVKPIVDLAYLLFARNRLRWFKNQSCENDVCKTHSKQD
jgi:predicted DCC family thiol-disulfide oxidoreductase YuxK